MTKELCEGRGRRVELTTTRDSTGQEHSNTMVRFTMKSSRGLKDLTDDEVHDDAE